MVIDQLMEQLYGKPYDRNGEVAREACVLQPLLEELLRNPYFNSKPPKTAGREEFGPEYVQAVLRRRGRAAKADLIATATALTARSIAQAIKSFVFPHAHEHVRFHTKYRDYVVSGGGSKNRTLTRMLAEEMAPLGLKLRRSDELGVPSQAKEAVAFALLAYQTWHRQPGNILSATGARRPAVLGKISYV
jgi:anhydro-N-acetylmuramic acid kinase